MSTMSTSGTGGAITPRQQRLITELIQREDVVSACAAAGVGRSTAYRWLKEPAFVAGLRAAETELLRLTTRKLSRLGVKAVAVLSDTLDDPDAGAAVKVRAADSVLNRLLQLRSAVELEERLAVLEAAVREQEERR